MYNVYFWVVFFFLSARLLCEYPWKSTLKYYFFPLLSSLNVPLLPQARNKETHSTRVPCQPQLLLFATLSYKPRRKPRPRSTWLLRNAHDNDNITVQQPPGLDSSAARPCILPRSNGPATATSAVIYRLLRVQVTPFIPSIFISIVYRYATTAPGKILVH